MIEFSVLYSARTAYSCFSYWTHSWMYVVKVWRIHRMEIIDEKCYQLSSRASRNKYYAGVYRQPPTLILRQSPQQSSQLRRGHNFHLRPWLQSSKLWALYMFIFLNSSGIWESGTFPAFISTYLRWVLLRFCFRDP